MRAKVSGIFPRQSEYRRSAWPAHSGNASRDMPGGRSIFHITSYSMKDRDKEVSQFLVERHFREMLKKDRKIHSAFLTAHSGRLGIHLDLAQGTTGGEPASLHQPYYIASVGKLFTSVLVAILSERGLLSYEDPAALYLDDEVTKGLHVCKGTDYSHDIRIRHLLNHTSGLHDYFEDRPAHGKRMIDLLLEEPSRFWTPRETVSWSKNNLKSHFPPGKGFHYSDTGYHILGLIIEKVTSKPFHEALSSHIFRPLGMAHSYLLQHSEPEIRSDCRVAGVYVGETDVVNFVSLSIDYAGGGIVSTSDDLLKFMESLVHHRIIRKDTFDGMKDWARFFPGIDYGYGLMSIRTVPFFMPRKYNAWGNAGSVGSFMFYHPVLDLYLIGTLNRFRYHRKAFRLMLKCIDIFSKAGHSS